MAENPLSRNPDGPRMGIEIEYRQIKIMFRREDASTGNPWYSGVDAQNNAQFPAGVESFFIPNDDSQYYTGGHVNWEGQWPFQIRSDSIGTGSYVQGASSNASLLELNGSAQPVDDWKFWIGTRISTKALYESAKYFEGEPPGPLVDTRLTQGKWYSLKAFLDRYNSSCQEAIQKAKRGNRDLNIGDTFFQLKFSPDVAALENGTHASLNGQKWKAYLGFSIDQANPGLRFMDVQINYQIDLEWLHDNLSNWVNMWRSMWVTSMVPKSLGDYRLDPEIGNLIKATPSTEVYNTQFYGALWLKAEQDAEDLLKARWDSVPNLKPKTTLRKNVKALIIYIMACACVGLHPSLLPKNSFPQMPKTSPSSIARLLGGLDTDVSKFLKDLSAYPASHGEFFGFVDENRKKDRLVADGFLQKKAPQIIPGQPNLVPAYSDGSSKDMLSFDIDKTHTASFWRFGLQQDNKDVPSGKSSLSSGSPFYCDWAGDIHTPYSAQDNGHGGAKMLFESRYGTSIINIGFHPGVEDFVFAKSYLRLLGTLHANALDLQTRKALKDVVNKFGPNPKDIEQNFPRDCATH